ncbi:MAG: TolC family protein [Armatimonadetes bacterium]|nr:TolC family protein [Armatimonadota bacterium]
MTVWMLAVMLAAEPLGPTPPAAPRETVVNPTSTTAPAPLTLDQAVAEALVSSLTARHARLVRDNALGQADLLRPRVRPDVKATANAELGPVVRDPAAPRAVVRRDVSARAQISVEQILLASGGDALQRRCEASATAARAEYGAALARLDYDVRLAWLDLAAAQAGSVLAGEALRLAEAQAKRVEDLLTVERVAEVDRLQARAGVLEARGAVVEAENGVALAQGNLNRLLGRPSLAAPIVVSGTDQLPAELGDIAAAVSWARDHRPEVVALAARIVEARAGAELARAQRGPTLSATATLGGGTAAAFDPAWDARVGVVARWPLSSTDNAAQRAEQEARGGALLAQVGLDELRAGIELEVRRAWLDDRAARARYALSTERLAAAQEAYRVKALQYDRQRATLIDVQQALVEQRKAALDRVLALVAAHRAVAAFRLATGNMDGN